MIIYLAIEFTLIPIIMAAIETTSKIPIIMADIETTSKAIASAIVHSVAAVAKQVL